jgi:hypothetical protein
VVVVWRFIFGVVMIVDQGIVMCCAEIFIQLLSLRDFLRARPAQISGNER